MPSLGVSAGARTVRTLPVLHGVGRPHRCHSTPFAPVRRQSTRRRVSDGVGDMALVSQEGAASMLGALAGPPDACYANVVCAILSASVLGIACFVRPLSASTPSNAHQCSSEGSLSCFKCSSIGCSATCTDRLSLCSQRATTAPSCLSLAARWRQQRLAGPLMHRSRRHRALRRVQESLQRPPASLCRRMPLRRQRLSRLQPRKVRATALTSYLVCWYCVQFKQHRQTKPLVATAAVNRQAMHAGRPKKSSAASNRHHSAQPLLHLWAPPP